MNRAAGVLALALVGCGGAGKSATNGDGDDGAAVYLMQTGISEPNGRMNLFSPFSSLDAPSVDASRSLVEAGNARLYAAPGVGTFMIGGGEDPTITRYDVDDSGAFTKGASLSFANQGVASMDYHAVVFVSPTKAYYRDGTQLQLIAFDPTAMTISRVIPVSNVALGGFTAGFGDAVTRADGIYFPVYYYHAVNYDHVPTGAVLVHVDPTDDSVTVTNDARCAGLEVSMTTADGDTYWFSSGLDTVAWRGYGLDHGVHDCALRLRHDQTTFDPSWSLDLTTRTGGWAAVAMMQGDARSIWLRVLDETAVTVPTPADYATFFGLDGCQWYSLDVTSDANAVRNDDRPLSTCGGGGFFVDSRAFTYESQNDYASSTLLELTAAGFVSRGHFNGFIADIARLK